MPQTYTVKQVADILGYSTNSIYTFLKEKRIKGVRVGKGRFRIPQAELDRLVGAAGKKQVSLVQQSQALAPAESVPAVYEPASPIVPSHGQSRIRVPNFFDWYLGTLAILASATMMLFLPAFEGIRIWQYLVFRPFLMAVLAVGAVGLLYTDILAYEFRRWRVVFYALVLFGLSVIGGVYLVNGEYIWTCVMISIVLTAVVRSWAAIDGKTAFVWHVMGMWTIVSLFFIAWPSSEYISLLVASVPLPFAVFLSLTMAPTFLLGFIVLRGQERYRHWETGLLSYTGGVFVVIALWLGGLAHWLQAFILLTVGFFALFVPVWHSLAMNRRDHQRIVFQIVGGMIALSLLAVVLLRLFQENMFSYAQVDLRQKADVSALTISSIVEKTQQALSVFAQNPLVVTAVQDENVSDLEALSRSVFESHATIGRVAVARTSGEVLSYYPLAGTSVNSSSLANRDYFIQAITTKRPVISDVISSVFTPSRPSVAIAVPLADSSREVLGVVVGVLNIDAINLMVQQVVSTPRGEYAVVVDKTKKRIIHPDETFVGSEVREYDPIVRGLAGESGVADDYAGQQDIEVAAYAPISDLHWSVSVKVAKQRVVENTQVSVTAVLALASVWVIVLLRILLRHRKQSDLPEETDTS